MSSKVDLKAAMTALNVKTPLKLNVKAPTFQAPKASIGPGVHGTSHDSTPAITPSSPPLSSNLEESGSKLNTVQNEQGPNLTLSKIDPVQSEPGPNQTGSILNPVEESATQRKRSTSPFTPVPHELLRGERQFTDPLDFMIYLHLYSYSWGFSRETASMSQAQLERFTGSARNTVRRSLERLIQQGWVKMVEEYECARMSRRWKVVSPENHGSKRETENGRKTGSKLDPVQNGPGLNLTPTRSNLNPLTGSKMNPYIERDPKEKSKNSLSVGSEKISEYLDSVLAPKKRESEKRAYLDLKSNFTDEQIELSLSHLQMRGTPGTQEPCHSPMAFLGRAMTEVLRSAEQELAKRQTEEDRRFNHEAQNRAQQEIEDQEKREWQKKERAFVQAFPSQDAQKSVVSEFCFGMPFPANSLAGRSFAIGKWWDALSEHERKQIRD